MVKLIKFILSYFFLFLFCFAISCQQQTDVSTGVTAERVSDRVIVFSCLDVNTTAIASSEGIIVIDTHRSPSVMLEIKKLMEKEFGRNDFLYVINTHGHYDHCSGNQVFPTSTIVGHENCPVFMRNNPARSPRNLWFTKYRVSELKGKLQGLNRDSNEAMQLRAKVAAWKMLLEDLEKGYKVTPPTKTFRDSLTLNPGDLTIKLIYCGKAHTDNDIFVYIPEEKVVFTGDMFSSSTHFGFSVNKIVDVPRVISSLNQILQDDTGIERVIAGHTDFLSGEDLKAVQNVLKERFAEFEGKESAALFLEEMIERFGLKLALQNYDELRSKQNGVHYFLEEEFAVLGNRLLGRGLIEEAIEAFKVTVKEFPNSALAYDYLGKAYLKKGDVELAVTNYEKSLQLFPDNRNAREILKMLRDEN
jgi:glyoxylase-like metal-dependent hydrolase (beta-lactamase superfamily II)